MAHYEKFDRYSIEHQFKHDSRENTEKRDRIDKDRIYLNYNLCDVEDPVKRNKELIEMIKNQGGRIRKDSVYMCSLIITLPKDFPDSEELEKQFFKSAKRHLDKIHGKENCLSAWVHRDEAQSHLHYRFCPIKYDEEKQKYKLCAKEILNRNFLKSFHKDLEKEMEEELGFKVSILNGATKEGHKTIKELIAETETKSIKQFTQKSILNEMWRHYKDYSSKYWNEYKRRKQEINNAIWEVKKGIKESEREIQKNLDFIHNMSKGFLYALYKFLGAIIMFFSKRVLENDLKALQANLEGIEATRRIISNQQHNTKEKLKQGDLEGIETALKKWENSLMNFDYQIRNIFEEKQKKKEEIEEEWDR